MRILLAIVVGGLVILGAWLLSQSEESQPNRDDVQEGSDTRVDARSEHIAATTSRMDGERITAANSEPGNWLAHGRTYDEQRFSPLDEINADNVSELGLAWYFDTDTNRGLEASPIVVDGVMYTSGSWSVVFANDARTGELIWAYDPEVPKAWGVNACCDVVNRGVAVWKGRVYVGTIDGRLIALDAVTGGVEWDINTIDRTKPYTITGAPRIVNDKVIIGNGGAEYGVRGYITAYDTETGDEAWRFYTVPGNPEDPLESETMKEAAKTWTGQWWTMGGGGTVWDSMSYDPELNQLYIGVGNGSPWNQNVRSPGGGDNLFLSSVVALNPDTGEYIWHYQTTPGDTWDYTATQHMILAELEIEGQMRKVLLQAPKNGFFYVLDRVTGEFISAKQYVPMTWATHVDPESGRPVESENARYQTASSLADLPLEDQITELDAMSAEEIEATLHKPGPLGGHNWHPMSYSPDTGLVYIPALDIPFAYGNEPQFEYEAGRWNLANDWRLNMPLGDDDVDGKIDGMLRGHVSAWDPVAQKEVWRIQHAGTWNGGMLSTHGNLIFQGNSSGQFVAYRADTGEELWSSPAQTGIIAPPISYSVDGEQYISVVAGWGGAFALTAAAAEGYKLKPRGRILTYKLGATQTLPPVTDVALEVPEPPPIEADDDEIAQGKFVYHKYCGVCHGPGVRAGGVIPDLRYLSPGKHIVFEDIVLGGILEERGMVSFAGSLDVEDSRAVHQYIISESHRLKAKSP
ncbi:MAG: quinohemoprotein ethanol dehydrogenase [Candidatus Azotimanducaceae bacterium]|jgi:quinohemoprotein ethanol dehydrogenase